jgi:DNA-binding SARP family transcriptional activator
MDIALFGALHLDVDGRRLGTADLGGVKPKEILEILLLARGGLVSKEALADGLWPHARPKNVPATLETYISVLRRHLGTDRARARQLVQTASGAYRFAVDEATLDVDRFDDLLRRAERAGRRERVALRVQAAALATGDLLEDSPYAAWVQEERQRYRDRVARTHLLLAEDLLGDGDLTGALRHGEAALALAPLAEEAFRALMLANHALGHTERARSVYEQCKAVLDAELGLDPTSETADLAGAIDAGAPAGELLAAAPFAPPPATLAPEGRVERRSPLGRLPFLGRTEELDRVHRHIRAARTGRLTLVLVEGRPGAGRTAFLQHLRATVSGPVGSVAYTPLEAERPALPFASALVDALAGGPGAAPAERYARAPWFAGEVEALQALRHLLEDHGPAVLLLDDLQWADPETFVALDWLTGQAPHLPVTVVASVRTAPPAPRIELGMLTVTESIRLGALDTSSPELAGIDPELARITGGDPALLADCFRWVQVHGPGCPPSLRQAVLRTVRGLGGTYPKLLRAAASLPEPFDVFDVMLAVDSPAGDLLAQLEHLCEVDLLRRLPEGFGFRAAIVRSVLADTGASQPEGTRRGLSSV